MSIDNIRSSCTAGMTTLTGTKAAGVGTVKLYIGSSTTPAGQDTNPGTTWKIGPLGLPVGTYPAKVTYTTGKEVFFTLTVSSALNSAVVTNLRYEGTE